MAKITLLKQGSENIYPLVHIDGVVDGNGDDMSTLLGLKQDTLTFDSTPTASSTNPVSSGGVYNALATYCPIIEDTRQSAVAAITGVAPFASLVDGQRILLHLAFPNLSNPTLQLTLSNGTPTSAYDIYGQIGTNVIKLILGYYRAEVYLPMIFANNRWNVIADANTLYDALTQALLNVGTDTSNRLISAQLLCDNFQKLTKIETLPSGAIAPTAGYEPNKMYDFGKVASVTFATYDTTKEISGCVNLYMFTFTVASGGTTVTLNANIKYPNGDDGTDFNDLLTEEDRVFECTIRDNKLTYVYFD